MCIKSTFSSGWKSFVLLEQWIYYVIDTRKLTSYIADYDAVTISEFNNALEQDNTRIDIQRIEVIYGNEPHVIQRVYK